MNRILRNGLAAGATAFVLAGTGIAAGLTGAAPAGAATTTACATTNTSTHETTATGEVESTETHKVKCGKNYQEWETRDTRTVAGATTHTNTYKNEYNYPHYTETIRETKVSAKGAVTYTVTHKSA